jgi:hypothetical protein
LRFIAPILCGAALLLSAQAHAEPSDADVDRRLAHVERVLERDQSRARTWRTVWMIAYGTLAIGQGTYAFLLTDDPDQRADFGVGAVKSALGFGALVVFPFRPAHAAADLDELPDRTPDQRRAKLRAAEQALRDSAQDEEFGIGWPSRIASSLVNLAGAYYLWIEHDLVGPGWLSLASGMAVSEVQIRTQPTGALDELSRRPSAGGPRALSISALPGPALLLSGSF